MPEVVDIKKPNILQTIFREGKRIGGKISTSFFGYNLMQEIENNPWNRLSSIEQSIASQKWMREYS